jgi:hypothetical protein
MVGELMAKIWDKMPIVDQLPYEELYWLYADLDEDEPLQNGLKKAARTLQKRKDIMEIPRCERLVELYNGLAYQAATQQIGNVPGRPRAASMASSTSSLSTAPSSAALDRDGSPTWSAPALAHSTTLPLVAWRSASASPCVVASSPTPSRSSRFNSI